MQKFLFEMFPTASGFPKISRVSSMSIMVLGAFLFLNKDFEPSLKKTFHTSSFLLKWKQNIYIYGQQNCFLAGSG